MDDVDWDALGLAYDEEKSAYTYYVKVKRGDDLVGGRVPDPEEVAEARDAWAMKYAALADAGGTAETLRELIRRRSSSKKVKRAQ